MYLILNNWSDGDAAWTAGPPNADAVMQIQSITLYSGYVPTENGNACLV